MWEAARHLQIAGKIRWVISSHLIHIKSSRSSLNFVLPWVPWRDSSGVWKVGCARRINVHTLELALNAERCLKGCVRLQCVKEQPERARYSPASYVRMPSWKFSRISGYLCTNLYWHGTDEIPSFPAAFDPRASQHNPGRKGWIWSLKNIFC